MRGKVILLFAVIAIKASNMLAQEDLAWVSTIEEYNFSGPTDSIPINKESNFHLVEDTSTNIHFSYYWDIASNEWHNESKSIGIFNRDANRLEMQNFFWSENNVWTGSARYVFWYDKNGDIQDYRSDIRDPFNHGNWLKRDSTGERWESDSLVQITEEFSRDEENHSWELTKSRRIEKYKNEEDIITSELELNWDISNSAWIPVSQTLHSYDNLGNITRKAIHFWIEAGEYWVEYIRHEFYDDNALGMRMEDRYEWDFKRSDWRLRFRGGESDGASPDMSYMIGLKDEKFYRWEVYEKVESEVDDHQMVIGSTVESKVSEFGDWEKISQTRSFYNEEQKPVLVTNSNWNKVSGKFEVVSKKYFYYPFVVDVQKPEQADAGYSIFPNPTSNTIFISGPAGFVAAYVFNLQGKMVRSTEQMQIDVSGFPAGLYLIRIQSTCGIVTHLRFIKI